MFDRARRAIAQAIMPTTSTRRFDGAAGGRRTMGFGTFGPISTETSAAGQTVRSRARYLAANNPFVANAVGNWVATLVGTGIRPTSKTAGAVDTFDTWQIDADADGRTDFYGLQATVATSLVVDGEAFLQLLQDDDGARVRVLPAELVDESLTRDIDNGTLIVNGVEFDSEGRRAAYHIRPQRLDQFASYAPPVRVPASDILHIFKPIGAGQVRGISWLAPIIVPANEFDQLVDALLVGVKIAAMHAGIVTDANATGQSPFDGEQRANILDSGLEPGTLKFLPAGFDVKFSTPQQAQQTAEFVKHSLRGLAAGLGLPDHLMSGDLSGANYSSIRAGLLPFRQRAEQIQYGVLVPQFLNPVWQRVQLLDGDIAARAEWIAPAWLQVDPKKAVEADILEINAGLKSRRQAINERGWSADQLDADIAADRARETALGLEFHPGADSPPTQEDGE